MENVTRYVTMFGGRLDPNRIFSNEGAEWNLRTLNPHPGLAGTDRKRGFTYDWMGRLLTADNPESGMMT